MFEKLFNFIKKHHKPIISSACGVVIVVCAFFAASLFGSNEAEPELSFTPMPSTVAAVVQTPTPTEAPTPSPSPSPTATPDRIIDFEGLSEVNEEILAWISIPGTNVDYPVVQTDNNSYYLDHDAMLANNHDGALFVDYINASDWSDLNTIIYGHRMNSGNMFGELYYYIDPEYFDTHKVLKIYTPDGMMEYEVFAAYETDDLYLPYKYDFETEAGFEEFVAEMGDTDADANISAVDLEYDDNILTLSTCVKGADDRRYLLLAVHRPEGVQTDTTQATPLPTTIG